MTELYHTRRKKVFPEARPGYKFCNGCEIEQPLEDYHRDPYSPDGRYTRCKTCKSAATPKSEHPIKVVRSEEVRAKRRAREQRKSEIRKAQKALIPPPPPPLFKVCPHCTPPTEKPIDEFATDSRRKDGHAGWCKSCQRVWTNSEEEKARQRDLRREMRRDPVQGPIIQERLNKWRRAHPLSQQEMTLRRNARKRAATIEPVNFEYILERDGFHCYICEQPILPGQKMDFDHRTPLSRGGSHSENNITPTHRTCNRRKGDKLPEELTAHDRQGLNP